MEHNDPESADALTTIDDAFRSRERIDSHIKDVLTKPLKRATCHKPLDVHSFSPTTHDRRDPLLENRVDPESFKVLEEAKRGVKMLGESLTKSVLQRFLVTYADLRRQEEEICTEDREQVLLNLKTEFERIGSLDLADDRLNDRGCVIVKPETSDNHLQHRVNDNASLISTELGNEIRPKEVTKTPETLTAGISTTLNNLEGLKKTQKQMEKAKDQMEGLCAYLDFRRVKNEANHTTVFHYSTKLSEHLSDMKKMLTSKRHGDKAELLKVMTDVKKRLKGAKVEYERWGLQETFLSQLLEHRNNDLNSLTSSLGKHKGKQQMDELEEKEEEAFSHYEEYGKELRHTIQQMGKLKSEMFDYTTRYQADICADIAQLETLFHVFETLRKAVQKANKQRSADLELKVQPPNLNALDLELERRLQATVRRVEGEKRSIANDFKFICFVGQNGSPRDKEGIDSTGLNDTQTEESVLDLRGTLEELGLMVNGFISTAKTTFMTLHAIQKLDGCLAFTKSKLDVLEFDLTHRKTYLEARNDALSRVKNLVHPRTEEYERKPSLKNNNTKVVTLPDVFDKSKIRTGDKPMFVNDGGKSLSRDELASNNSSIGGWDKTQHADGEILNETIVGCHGELLKLADFFTPAVTETDSSEISGWCTGETAMGFGCLNEDDSGAIAAIPHTLPTTFHHKTQPQEQTVRQQGALDMAKHYNLQGQELQGFCPHVPRRFLFYTKGIGVFLDDDGGLVDALGFPFPKQRQQPGKAPVLEAMASDAITRLKSKITFRRRRRKGRRDLSGHV